MQLATGDAVTGGFLVTSVFTWTPPPSYLGTYWLAFVEGNERALVDVAVGNPAR